MPDTSIFTIVDYDGQQGSMVLNIPVITAVNLAGILGEIDDIRLGLPEIILGKVLSTGFSSRIQYNASTERAEDPAAQRGNKWLFHTQDVTVNLGAGVPNPYFAKPFTYEIPTAKLSLRLDNNNVVYVREGVANIPEFDTFVPLFETHAKSPVGGTLQVERVEAATTSGG